MLPVGWAWLAEMSGAHAAASRKNAATWFAPCRIPFANPKHLSPLWFRTARFWIWSGTALQSIKVRGCTFLQVWMHCFLSLCRPSPIYSQTRYGFLLGKELIPNENLYRHSLKITLSFLFLLQRASSLQVVRTRNQLQKRTGMTTGSDITTYSVMHFFHFFGFLWRMECAWLLLWRMAHSADWSDCGFASECGSFLYPLQEVVCVFSGGLPASQRIDACTGTKDTHVCRLLVLFILVRACALNKLQYQPQPLFSLPQCAHTFKYMQNSSFTSCL